MDHGLDGSDGYPPITICVNQPYPSYPWSHYLLVPLYGIIVHNSLRTTTFSLNIYFLIG